jgi:hypothetical protein
VPSLPSSCWPCSAVIFFFGTRLVPGWIEKLAFDYLALGAGAAPGLSLGTLVGLLLAVELVRSLVDYGGKISETLLRSRGGSLLRANVVQNAAPAGSAAAAGARRGCRRPSGR